MRINATNCHKIPASNEFTSCWLMRNWTNKAIMRQSSRQCRLDTNNAEIVKSHNDFIELKFQVPWILHWNIATRKVCFISWCLVYDSSQTTLLPSLAHIAITTKYVWLKHMAVELAYTRFNIYDMFPEWCVPWVLKTPDSHARNKLSSADKATS